MTMNNNKAAAPSNSFWTSAPAGAPAAAPRTTTLILPHLYKHQSKFLSPTFCSRVTLEQSSTHVFKVWDTRS